MKQGWEVKTLGEVCEVKTGKSNAVDADENGKYAFFDRSKKTKKSHRFLFDCEALIIPGEGAQFFPRYYSGKFDLHQRVYSISNFPKEVDIHFVKYYLIFNHKHFEKVAVGATVKSLRLRHFTEIKIPIPTLAEQKAIVKKLDSCFNQISQAKTNLEQNLQNTKALFQSTLTQTFQNPSDDWQVKTLGEVCETGAGGTPLKSNEDYYKKGNIPWLRSGEICKKDIIKNKLFITEKGLHNSSAKVFPANTVLIAMYGATAGQVGVLRFKSSTNQAVCGIFPNDNFIPEFLYYKFLLGKDELIKQAVGGAQPNISQIKIKNTAIPIPPLAEQKAIVKKLDVLSTQTKTLEQNYQNQLKSLEELKKSLLEKAFTGGL